MIRVELEKMEEMYLLSAQGHATGSVPVCAAVSSMVCALARWLEKRKVLDRAAHLAPGEAWLWCRRGEAVDVAFDLALTGLRQLARKYPDLIRVEVSQ